VLRIPSNYWLGLLKHKKVIEFDLGIVAWEGEHRLRCLLLQLYHILATGKDCGDPLRMTIHTMSPAVRSIQAEIGPSALAMLGNPSGHAGTTGGACDADRPLGGPDRPGALDEARF
jgi:hypothetical protein